MVIVVYKGTQRGMLAGSYIQPGERRKVTRDQYELANRRSPGLFEVINERKPDDNDKPASSPGASGRRPANRGSTKTGDTGGGSGAVEATANDSPDNAIG